MYVRQHKLLFDSNTVVLISISSLFIFLTSAHFFCVCVSRKEREKKKPTSQPAGKRFFFFLFYFSYSFPFCVCCVLHPYHVRLLTRLSLFLKGRMSSFFLTGLSNVRYTQPLVPVYDSGPFSYFLFSFLSQLCSTGWVTHNSPKPWITK